MSPRATRILLNFTHCLFETTLAKPYLSAHSSLKLEAILHVA
ncbi:hypothetical protein CAMGR0001_2297 [Campylobacter gracilis RM3268]|uniref:Uncharacterized protein n=1 Tax=Campylobacter gracilis RM3268 TaxID=553220 RepID=C8PHA2_9BACT|nr:hypothetical protein CAMGR0001_2297 [Campylobacter gracilis RM3268]